MANNLSMNKLDALIEHMGTKAPSTLSFPIAEENIEIEVKHVISAEEMSELVRSVVSNLFVSNEDGDTIYMPERRDLALAANILSYYTNLKDGLGNKRLVSLVYDTDIFESIKEKISVCQMVDIETYVDRLTAFLCDSIHAEQKSRIADAVAKIDAAANAFKALNEQFSAMGTERVQKFVDNVIDFTPEDFARAVAKAQEAE